MEMNVDNKLSNESNNPIANSVVKRALDRKADTIMLNRYVKDETMMNHEKSNSHVTEEERALWNSKTSVIVDDAIEPESNNPVSGGIIYKKLLTINETLRKLLSHMSDDTVHIDVNERKLIQNMICRKVILKESFKENFSELLYHISDFDTITINYLSGKNLESKILSTIHITEDVNIKLDSAIVKFSQDKDKKDKIYFVENNDVEILSIIGTKVNQ